MWLCFASMPDIVIGSWIRRARHSGTKWHLVDSLVNDIPLTRCGRDMVPRLPDGRDLEVSSVMPLTRMIGQPQLCKYCDTGTP